MEDYNITDVFGTMVNNSYGLPGYDESELEYGYKVYFAKDIQGNERAYDYMNGYFDDSPYTSIIYKENKNESGIYDEEYVAVVVTPRGVNQLVNINQMAIDEIVNDDVTVMAFDDIDKIAQETFSSHEFDTGYNEDIEVSEIKLALCQIEKDGGYEVVPAWYYLFEMPNGNSPIKKCLICINAIDGSVIR